MKLIDLKQLSGQWINILLMETTTQTINYIGNSCS